MGDFYRKLVKAELHVHLEGSVEPETMREMNPSLETDEILSRYRCRDFEGFIRTYIWILDQLKSPGAYALATRRLLERLAAENVRYAEINLSAGAILHRGKPFGPIYDAVAREAERSPVEVRWIFDAIRHFGPGPAMEVAKLAVERAGAGVAAFGIGGDEERGPVEWFAEIFRFVKQHGLKVAPHAGESMGPESVWAALQAGADRIGHGVRSIDDPELMKHLCEHDIALEVCVSSNVATGLYESIAAHPVRRLFDAGVPIVLNTDDPAIFRTTLAGEYELVARQFGFTNAEMEQLARNSFRYAFEK